VGEPKAFERAFTKSGLFAPSAAYVSIANGEVGYNPAGHPPLTYAALMCLSNDPAIQNDLMKLIVEGKLKVPIDQAYPFTQEGVLQAFEKVDSKKSLGKNIIKMV
jgi:NADPH:quinone reductase-like Zn-dependent oxidoreductase